MGRKEKHLKEQTFDHRKKKAFLEKEFFHISKNSLIMNLSPPPPPSFFLWNTYEKIYKTNNKRAIASLSLIKFSLGWESPT